MTPIQIFYLSLIVLLTVLRAALPFLMSPRRVFHQNIPLGKENNTELVNHKMAYSISVSALSLVALSYVVKGNNLGGYVFPAICILLCSADCLIYFVYHNKVKQISERNQWESQAIPKAERPFHPLFTPAVVSFVLLILVGSVVAFIP